MAVWLDGGFWSGHFRRVFIPQVNAFCDALLRRVMPTFAEIEKEADAIAEAEFQRYMHMPAEDEGDPASAAEDAEQTGVLYYQTLNAVRQSLLNLGVAGLYHLFEQQLLLYHRRQLLYPSEENDRKKNSLEEMFKRLQEAGIELKSLSTWPRVNEARVIANTVKHAEGRSSDELRTLRAELFAPPYMRENDSSSPITAPMVEMPLAGEDLYLTEDDVQLYRQAIVSFWHEFGEAIERASRRASAN